MGNQCECPALTGPDGDITSQPVYISKNSPDSTRKFLESLIEVEDGLSKIQVPEPFAKIKEQYIDSTEKPVVWKTTFPTDFYIWRIGQKMKEKEALLEGKVGLFLIYQNKKEEEGKQEEKEKKQAEEIVVFYCGNIKECEASDENAIYIDKQNSQYEGKIENSKAFGKGTYTNSKKGYTYEGEWNNDKPHGKGIQKFAQTTYEGQFYNGDKHGSGKYTVKKGNDESCYTGQFIDGVFDGKGTLEDKEFKYEGDFEKGQKNGFGMWQNKLTKEKYEGNFLNGEKDGKGKYTFQDGSIYEGNFKNDVPEGEGTIIKDSQRIEGLWQNGKNVIFRKVEKNANSSKEQK